MNPGQLADSHSTPVETLAEQARWVHERTREAVRGVVVGLDGVVTQLLMALVARGHILMEGVPGTAKTTLCKTFARILGIDYHRIQFTPDLLPSDVTGTHIFDRKANDFVLRRGPIFCQVLLADELNRAPAKTQSALLEAMQEYQVTIEGTTLALPEPFMVLATQNPIEQEGVYRLPEAQLDRFLLRADVSYPDRLAEIGMLDLHSDPPPLPDALFDTALIRGLQDGLHAVFAAEGLREYIVDLARASRTHPDVALGASPRAALFLMRAARARALLEGRTYFTHEDVQAVALPVLTHRLILRPEAEIEGESVASVIQEVIDSVPVLRLKTAPETRGPHG
jgi:MoxR-like ATPase